MAEENKVEQTTQPEVSRETSETKTEETKAEVNSNTFSGLALGPAQNQSTYDSVYDLAVQSTRSE